MNEKKEAGRVERHRVSETAQQEHTLKQSSEHDRENNKGEWPGSVHMLLVVASSSRYSYYTVFG